MFGVFAAHRLAAARDRRTTRIAANIKFREKILTELKGLYPSPVQWPDEGFRIIDVLEAKFPVLESAVVEFRGHLSWFGKRNFDSAWRNYRCSKGGLPYFHYVAMQSEGHDKGERYVTDTRLTYQTDFKKNVDHLLSFADET